MRAASELWRTTDMPTRPHSIGDEARLLFLCAGPRVNDAEIAALAGGGLQWSVVTHLALAARAVPVIARRVREAMGGTLPAAAANLGRLAMVEEFELQRMEERLDETVAAFEAAGVEMVLLKGAALARSVFASVADRPMLDLDVLVPADKTDAARAAAASAGWVWKHDRRYAPFFSTHHHLPPLHDSRGTRALLELHTGLFPAGHPFQLEATSVADRAVRTRGRNREALIPSTEDHLVYLCSHWVWSHMMNGGAWRAFRDVGALAERGGSTGNGAWRGPARPARQRACTGRCASRIALPASTFQPRRCVPWSRRPQRSVLHRLERYFVWQLAGGRACPSVRLAEMLWSAALRPRWSGHGPARPWKNPEVSIWVADARAPRPSATRRLVESLGFARVFVGM